MIFHSYVSLPEGIPKTWHLFFKRTGISAFRDTARGHCCSSGALTHHWDFTAQKWLQWGYPKSWHLWFLILITVVNGVYKPSYSWVASHCKSCGPTPLHHPNQRWPWQVVFKAPWWLGDPPGIPHDLIKPPKMGRNHYLGSCRPWRLPLELWICTMGAPPFTIAKLVNIPPLWFMIP